MWHWLKGHKWKVISLSCDNRLHYLDAPNSGHYQVTHAMFECTGCGMLKTKQYRGEFKLKEKDTLADALHYLEK